MAKKRPGLVGLTETQDFVLTYPVDKQITWSIASDTAHGEIRHINPLATGGML